MRIDAANQMDEMYIAQGAAQKDRQTCKKSKRRRAKSPPSSYDQCLNNLQYQADDEQASYLAVDNALMHVEAEHAMFSSNSESDWEVSDFLSSDDSGDDWIP